MEPHRRPIPVPGDDRLRPNPAELAEALECLPHDARLRFAIDMASELLFLVADRLRGYMRRYGASTSQIRADVGESFILELPALATSGHTWQMTGKPDIATLSDERTRPGGPAIGSPSIQEFEFIATRAGKDTLLMVYKRPWETTVADQLEVSLVVKR